MGRTLTPSFKGEDICDPTERRSRHIAVVTGVRLSYDTSKLGPSHSTHTT